MKMWTKSMAVGVLAAALLLPYAPGMAAAADAAATGTDASGTNTSAALTPDEEALVQAYENLQQHYTKPDKDKLLDAAINGMIDTLDDPFTNYMTAKEYQEFMGAVNQTYAGIGVTTKAAEGNDAMIITEIYAGSPAEKAGLQVNDRIVKVDGKSAPKDHPEELLDGVRGEVGTKVVLTIVRGSAAEQEFTITREEIQLPLVESADLGDNIKQIAIRSFGNGTSSAFQKELDKAESDGAKGIVLDLRGDGGGLVMEALLVADALMDKGTIVAFHNTDGTKDTIEAEPGGSKLPVAVLMDRNTASASEILAGALQKNGRAKLVGTTSYGKGTMQVPVSLNNGAFLKVSIDRWELPDGTTNNKVGLQPDVRLTQPALFANAAKQLLLPGIQQRLDYSLTEAKMKLNGKLELTDGPKPVQQNGTWFVPLRATVESFGSEVKWTSDGAVAFQLADADVKVNMKAGSVSKSGTAVESTGGLANIGGMSYISADLWAKLSGHTVETNSTTLTLYNK